MPPGLTDPVKQAKIAKALKVVKYCNRVTLLSLLLFLAVANGAVEWVSVELCLLKFALAGWLP